MIEIYVPIPKDTRKTTKNPKSATSKDVQIDIKLIFLRASLDTYSLILNAWQLWQWSSLIKFAPQNGHLSSFVVIYFKSQHSSNHSSTTFPGKRNQQQNVLYFFVLLSQLPQQLRNCSMILLHLIS